MCEKVFQNKFHLLPKTYKIYPFCAPIFHPISESESYGLVFNLMLCFEFLVNFYMFNEVEYNIKTGSVVHLGKDDIF